MDPSFEGDSVVWSDQTEVSVFRWIAMAGGMEQWSAGGVAQGSGDHVRFPSDLAIQEARPTAA